MRYMLIVFMLMFTACGSLRDNCHLEGQTCRTLFGESDFVTDSKFDDAFDRIETNENNIANLQKSVNQLLTTVNVLENNVTQNTSMISLLESQLNQLSITNSTQNTTLVSLQTSVNMLYSQNTSLNTAINNQQTQINSMLTNLATLNGYVNIVSVYDPCGDKPGKYDEVFLVLSTGEFLSSFSDNANGLNTRFSKLTPGSFMTTDSTNCYFTVVADPQSGKPNQVKILNEHY